jgi:anaerobic selenocysteine-containing dehydrogenase
MPASSPAANGSLRLGTFRSLWTSKEVDVSPALAFLRPGQVVELSPADAAARGIAHGDEVEVAANGTTLSAKAMLRQAVPAGSAFLVEGTHESPANALTEPLITITRHGGPATPGADADAAPIISTPAAGPLDPDQSAGGA